MGFFRTFRICVPRLPGKTNRGPMRWELWLHFGGLAPFGTGNAARPKLAGGSRLVPVIVRPLPDLNVPSPSRTFPPNDSGREGHQTYANQPQTL